MTDVIGLTLNQYGISYHTTRSYKIEGGGGREKMF